MDKEFFESRAFIYGLLSSIFRGTADVEFLTQLKNMDIIRSFPLKTNNDKVKYGLATIAEYLDQITADDCHNLGEEYSLLFLGPTMKAPLWESVYRTTGGIVFGQSTLSVREAYREFDLVVKEINSEPDDNIAIELGFMCYLCQEAAEAVANQEREKLADILSAQQRFLSEHLNIWVGDFSRLVTEAEVSNFYKGFAVLTKGFVENEIQYRQDAGNTAQASMMHVFLGEEV